MACPAFQLVNTIPSYQTNDAIWVQKQIQDSVPKKGDHKLSTPLLKGYCHSMQHILQLRSKPNNRSVFSRTV